MGTLPMGPASLKRQCHLVTDDEADAEIFLHAGSAGGLRCI